MNRADKKLHRDREIVVDLRLSGGSVAPRACLQRASIGVNPETKYKHSKNVFAVTSVVLSFGHRGPQFLELPAQSVPVSNRA